MTVDLVISAYKADLGWLKGYSRPGVNIIVYDKGAPRVLPTVWNEYETLPNVGKIDHTIAHHIVRCYHALADWTVFCPDHPFDHLGGKDFADMLTPRESVLVPWLCTVKDWGDDGRLQWEQWTNRPDANGTNWAERYASGKIQRAELSFVQWAHLLGIDLTAWSGYHPGAVMGVPKSAILRHPKSMYEAIRDALSHSIEPEAGHYAERLWVSLFAT